MKMFEWFKKWFNKDISEELRSIHNNISDIAISVKQQSGEIGVLQEEIKAISSNIRESKGNLFELINEIFKEIPVQVKMDATIRGKTAILDEIKSMASATIQTVKAQSFAYSELKERIDRLDVLINNLHECIIIISGDINGKIVKRKSKNK